MDYPVFIIDQLSQQLRALRKSRGWSQTELARRLGVTQARVTTIERNPSAVSVGQLFEILQLLGARLVLRNLLTSAPSSGAVTPQTQTLSAEHPGDKHSPVVADADYTPKGEW